MSDSRTLLSEKYTQAACHSSCKILRTGEFAILYAFNARVGSAIGHFGKYHNTLCLALQIAHKHCVQLLLGLTMAPRENRNNAYARFGGQTKSIMVFPEVGYSCGQYCIGLPVTRFLLLANGILAIVRTIFLRIILNDERKKKCMLECSFHSDLE